MRLGERGTVGGNESKSVTLTPQFDMLASAIAGRTVRIARGPSGGPCWTDGRLVYADDTTAESVQIAAILIQASLISAGSLASEVMRSLSRRPELAKRYLTVEAHRALHTNRAALPPMMHSMIDHALATRSCSPAESLALARSRTELPPCPPQFGVLYPKRVLAADREATGSHDAHHAPKRQNDALKELDDTDFADADESAAVDMFSAGGVSGVFGRLLKRLLRSMRRREPGGGNPGTDSATHMSRGLAQQRGNGVLSRAAMRDVDDDAPDDAGTKYPEWDAKRRAYRRDWCTVNEIEPPDRDVGDTT